MAINKAPIKIQSVDIRGRVVYRSLIYKVILAFSVVSFISPAMAALDKGTGQVCQPNLTNYIPARDRNAISASKLAAKAKRLHGKKRDGLILDQVMSGNLPEFLRRLQPVTIKKRVGGRLKTVTLCVMPDYLAVGSNKDFMRVPMGLDAAMIIADQFDFVLPTTKIVDIIHAQADSRLTPRPMKPGRQMTSTNYFARHNQLVERQRRNMGVSLGTLIAGHKKDLVISNRMWKRSNRVAIYGWHRRNGRRIQPLTTVHGAGYADYSHGVRLISSTVYVDGKKRSIYDVLGDRKLASLVSKEGRIRNAQRLIASNRSINRSRLLASVQPTISRSRATLLASAKINKPVRALSRQKASIKAKAKSRPARLIASAKQKKKTSRSPLVASVKLKRYKPSKKVKVIKLASRKVTSVWNTSFL